MWSVSNYRKYRLLEMIPGSLIWLTFLAAVVISWRWPLVMIYLIIMYDFYWMMKVIYLSTFLLLCYRRYRRTMNINWMQRLQTIPDSAGIYHLVIIPNSTETETVVTATLAALANTTYSADRLFVIYAAEQRYPESQRLGEMMTSRYQDRFAECIMYVHPDNLPGELAAKGANIAWAGKQALRDIIDQRGLAHDRVIVTVLDTDSCVVPQFFDYLTVTYLTEPNPTRASYQPIPMFTNNIWDAPAIMRVAATGTTFWLMSEQVRPERLFTFSSHCTPLTALVDVGWWQTDIVSDDSRIFLQCFLQYDGDYRVVPLYMPIYMDTVLAATWWRSLLNLYKQQRRWAWGSENIPFMMWHFWKARQIPWRKRLFHLINQMEGMWSWATASVIIFVFGYVPLWLIQPTSASTTVIAQNAPIVLYYILNIANIGLLLSVILGTLILPQRPAHYRPRRYIVMVLQWLLLPISMVVFGTLPATEAQTRLLLGRYLGFYVTEKTRHSARDRIS
ncbi:MAG: hypothetical protein HYV33_00455 [Candidatus Kerfeldbacteria bacterium]|nr:hypothetical protein [Candidatus Kerfeldbacteria bacterium]